MSDTPRTDAQAQTEYPHWRDAMIGMAEHARTLERELAEANAANVTLVRWKGEIDSHLIAAKVEFPEDYHVSPKWAIAKLQAIALSETQRELAEARGAAVAANRELERRNKPFTLMMPCERHKGIPFTFHTTVATTPAARQVCPHCHPEEFQ